MRNMRLVWRYSHLCLALISGVFIFAAAITGALLCFDPAIKMLDKSSINNASKTSISTTLQALEGSYEEVLYIQLDPNRRLSASIFDFDKDLNGDFFIDPRTAEIISIAKDQSVFFSFITNFHRSLFLKTTGRAIIGLTSAFLILILISGTCLLVSRQGSLMALFLTFKRDDMLSYSHIVMSRWCIIPVFIIALSGIYLSLNRFELIPDGHNSVISFDQIKDAQATSIPEFDIFKNTPLKQLIKLEFPFSTSDDDYFRLSLKQKEYLIHQHTGQILKETTFASTTKLHMLSFNLHTGSGNMIWNIILFLSAISLLLLLFTGVKIALRRSKKSKSKDVNLDQFEYIILVGSESGVTYEFADMLKAALVEQGKTVGIGKMNDYKVFPRLTHLFIITSTYGEGDAPSSASKFLDLLETVRQANSFKYSIVGFGSLAYQYFCGFAKDTANAMNNLSGATEIIQPHYIHNQSMPDFIKWTKELSQVMGIPLKVVKTQKDENIDLHELKLVDKSTIKDEFDETFMLTLDTPEGFHFNNGDLLSITPPEESLARQYSIGSNPQGQILLSIKKHEFGKCSNYLNDLTLGDAIKASLDFNSSFHFPPMSPHVILIANGTGIAPFVGMIHQNPKQIPVTLYWGGRTKKAFSLYQSQIDLAQNNGKLHDVKLAFSRELQLDKNYVQDLLATDIENIIEKLKDRAVIMICGSVSMQKGVLEVLEQGCKDFNAEPLNHYIKMKKIRMDCY